MNEKEKAKELVEKFEEHTSAHGMNGRYDVLDAMTKTRAKQCALIHVDEMIKELDGIYTRESVGRMEYYIDVKTEIENI